MTTLAEFIDIGRKHGRANLHLKVPDFQHFYARYGPRWLNHQVYRQVLDVATVEVKRELWGTGVFTRFFHQFRKDYPDIPIYVENAAPRFQGLLLRIGFRLHEFNPDSFYFIEGICSAPTSTSSDPANGKSSDSGSEIPFAVTGTTTTSKAIENESSEPVVSASPENSSTTVRSTTSSKRRKPTW